MAEVIQNVAEKKTTTNITDSSKSKQSSSNATATSLKQAKIGFLPRKKVVPTLLKADSSTDSSKKTSDSKTNETNKNSNDKSPVKKSSHKTDIVKNSSSSSKTSKHEENGGIKQNGKNTTPSKKSSKSEVSLVQHKHKSKSYDNSKSSKTKTSKEKSSKDSKSKSTTPVKMPVTTVKKPTPTLKTPTPKKTTENNDKKDASSTKTLPNSTNNSSTKKSSDIMQVTSKVSASPSQTLHIPNKGRLNTTMKGNVNSPVEIKSSDEDDDEMPLSQIKKKCNPAVKLTDFASVIPAKSVHHITSTKKGAPVNIKVVSNPRANPLSQNQNRGKLNQTVQALYSRQANGPIQNAMKSMPVVAGKPTPPPLHPVPTKNIIIAIDMDPQKWKSLSPQEQTRIIEHKKELARKHLLATNNQAHILPQSRNPITPPAMNVHPSKVSPLHSKVHGSNKPYTVHMSSPNSYFGPRTPNFPSHMSSRVVPQLGQNVSMQQSHNNFNLKQFSLKQEESTMVDLKPLPLTKKIPMPPGFPNKLFGDIVMIVEFVNTFRTFLMQNIKLDAVTLMIGVTPGSDKADVVAQILLMFLKILLSNEDYKVRGLKMELADLPLTEFTVSFLVCQLIKSQLETKRRLRKEKERAEKAAKVASATELIGSGSDEDLDVAQLIDSDDDDDGEWKKKKKKKVECVDVLEIKLGNIATQLESREFWQIATLYQITVLTFLIDLILDSEDLSEYYDGVMEEKHKAHREIDEQRKKKASRTKQMSLWESKPDNEKTTGDKDKEDKDKEKEDAPDETPKEDPYTGLTQRQKEVLKLELEKNVEKRKEKERLEEQHMKAQHDKCSAKLTTVIALVKRVMRVEPLGEDRFHRLYWFFTEGIPGLYVSNCCVDAMVQHPLYAKPQETWSYYNKEEDINQLLCALTVRGLREEKLKSCIREKHMAILASVKDIKEIEMYKMIRRSRQIQQDKEKKEQLKRMEALKPKEEIKVITTEEKEKGTVEEKKDNTEEKDGNMDVIDDVKDKEVTEEGAGGKVESEDSITVQEKKVDVVDAKEVEENDKKDKGDEKKVVGDEKVEKMEVEEETKKEGEGEKESESVKVESEGVKVEGEGKKVESEDKKVDSGEKVESEGVKVEGEGKKVDSGGEKVDSEGKKVEGEKEKEMEVEVVEKEKVEGKKEEGGEKVTEEDKKKKVIQIDDDDDDEDDEKLMELVGKNAGVDTVYDAHEASIGALKTDIIESANRIVHGSLGELTELETWTQRVSSVTDVQGLKEFVLQIQSCIVPKFFLSPFKTTSDNITRDWCRWVDNCMTLSTMHMLYGLLENSIKWESSAENMRCKVCRRKKGSEQIEQIIVCDGCHLGYHSHCLRPPLSYIPEGEWKCTSCMPKERRTKATKGQKKIRQDEEGEMSDKGSQEQKQSLEESDHEEVCHECESDGMLILCDTCSLSFHLECHKPPLHHAPRGNWSCYECNSRPKKRGAAKRTTANSLEKSKYAEYSSDNSEKDSTATMSSEGEFMPKKKKKKKQAVLTFTKIKQKKNTASKKNIRKKRTVRNMEESTEDDNDDDDDDDDDEEEDDDEENTEENENSASEVSEQDEVPKGRRAKKQTLANNKKNKETKTKRVATRTRKKKKLSSDDDDDDDDDDKTTRPPRGKKKKKISSTEEDEEEEEEEEEEEVEEEEEEEESETKKNFKKKSGSKDEHDDDDDDDDDGDNNKSKKTVKNSKKKRKRGSSVDEDDNNSNSNNITKSREKKEEWEKTQISPTLGNRRPCYAKDGLRKKREARLKNRQKGSSADDSPEKSDDDDKINDEEKDEDKNKPGDEKEEKKQQEVLRNLSSADRSYRQAGRNSRRCNYEMQACRNILSSLRKHKDAWPFLVPVNVKQAPDYLTIIEKPMDFSLVLRHLDDFIYDDALQFVADVKLVFDNSTKYNSDTSLVGEAGIRLHEEFQNLLKIHLPEVHATLQS